MYTIFILPPVVISWLLADRQVTSSVHVEIHPVWLSVTRRWPKRKELHVSPWATPIQLSLQMWKTTKTMSRHSGYLTSITHWLHLVPLFLTMSCQEKEIQIYTYTTQSLLFGERTRRNLTSYLYYGAKKTKFQTNKQTVGRDGQSFLVWSHGIQSHNLTIKRGD